MDSGPLCNQMILVKKLDRQGRTIIITSGCSSSEGGIKNENRRKKIWKTIREQRIYKA